MTSHRSVKVAQNNDYLPNKTTIKGRVCDLKRDRAGYAMLKSSNKDETAVHGCHCWGDMVICAHA